MGIQGRGSACLLNAAWLLKIAILMSLMMMMMIQRKQICAEATQYTVGDSTKKWNLNVDYSSWAAKYSFKTGDTLLFSYNAEAHSVYQVSQADYGSCNNLNPIKMYSDGNTVIDLNEATTYYFICGVSGHCAAGMKVVIKVEEASTSTSPISSPPSPIAPPPTKASSVPPTSAPPPKTPSSTPPTSQPPLINTPPPTKETPAKTPTSPPLSTPTKPPSSHPSPTSLPSPTPSPTPSISPALASSPSPLLSLSPPTLLSPPTSSESISSTRPITVLGGLTSLQAIIFINILLGALSTMINI